MAVISRDTFEALRGYVGVRLQQGVPIVDADWNELEDARKFELRAFLKWFVGDGVPEGTNGFRIEGTSLANDFVIRAGITGPADGLRNVGRCLVDGLDVIITADINFTAQPLHPSQTGSAGLATAWGVSQIQALTTPATDGTVVVYLDVWERLVTPNEDPSLVLSGLGTESCARKKREWVVRVGNGTSLPSPPSGHSFYTLATITRRTGVNTITPGDITDRREQRLLLPPATLISDLFGTNPAEYRRGQGRPAISFREAINALLRGELPSTPDAAIAPAPAPTINVTKRAFLFDNTNGLVAVWQSDRVGGTTQIFATRLNLDNVSAGFVTPPQQVTTGTTEKSESHAVLLPNGDLMVAYQSGVASASDVLFKRAALAGLNAAPEQPIANTGGVAESNPFMVISGDLVTCFYHLGSTNRWQYRRRRHTNNTWVDTPAVEFSAEPAQTDFHAARDGSGNIWTAFTTNTGNIQVLRFTPSTGAVAAPIANSLDSGAVDQEPFVLCTTSNEVWIFWRSPNGVHHARFSGGAWQSAPPSNTPIPNTIAGDVQPCVVEDVDGGIWLFWARGAVGSRDVFFMRRNPATGNWGQPRQLTISARDDNRPFTLLAPNNAIWIFWSSDRDGNINPYYKRLVTAL
ncbi:DUF6519 domain-containing protein [Phormidesmis sp. 146-35]